MLSFISTPQLSTFTLEERAARVAIDKMRVIRTFVFPWFVFFIAAVATYVIAGIKAPTAFAKLEQQFPLILAIGTGACVFFNVRSMGSLGIWLSESLPESLRYGSGRWFYRAFLAAVIAAIFWGLSKLPWTPLIWQAVILPVVVTIALFVVVGNLLGPVLKISANMAWSRFFAVLLSWPIVGIVPLTAIFVAQMILEAYQASHADHSAVAMTTQEAPEEVSVKGRVLSVYGDEMRVYGEWPAGSGEQKAIEVQLAGLTLSQRSALPKAPTDKDVSMTLTSKALKPLEMKSKPGALDDKDIRDRLASTKSSTRAGAFREISELAVTCGEYTKEIQNALDPKAPGPVAYWATQAVRCSEVKTVIALPRLAELMMHHSDAAVRGAAIRAMRKYGNENIKQIAYLIIKRMNPEEKAEVVLAAASVLAPVDADHARLATNRLKALLDSQELSGVAAQSLVKDLGRADLVTEYVSLNLGQTDAGARLRAVQMVCMLPPKDRAVAQPHLSNILALIKDADQKDPGLKALDCLGKPGFEALSAELANPQRLEKPVAARALAQLDVDEFPEAIELANSCSRDQDEQVSKWCSQSLGRLGAPALPKILEMLKSNNSSLKEAGKNALRFFDDPAAKGDLEKIVRENSGWMANNKNLQVAKAVANALVKIEGRTSSTSAASSSAQ